MTNEKMKSSAYLRSVIAQAPAVGGCHAHGAMHREHERNEKLFSKGKKAMHGSD